MAAHDEENVVNARSEQESSASSKEQLAPQPEDAGSVAANAADPEIREEAAAGDSPAEQAGARAEEPSTGGAASLDREPAIAALTPAGSVKTRTPEPTPAEEPNPPAVEPASLEAAVLAQSRRHTRRSFAVAALGVAAGYGFYRWLPGSRADDDQPELLRRTFQANAAISRALFGDHALAPTYPLSKSENLRVNGVYGLKLALVPESWRLQLVGSRFMEGHPRFSKDVTAWEYLYTSAPHEDQGHDTKVAPSVNTAKKMASQIEMAAAMGQQERTARMPRGQEEAGESHSTLMPGTSGLLLTMSDITQLPRHELITQFKCIEGWSQIVHWAGVRMADFLDMYPPAPVDGRAPRYVYMETPNGDYYTGYDMQIMRHPQTLLVTEMMGAPLTQFHGAPLRLHMPTKYGYKQIKRIGLIRYMDEKPDDYWTKLGYDWYAGL